VCRGKNGHTHGLHPYPAKFIPHIPRAIIRKYALRGLPVLDPMCGSGTTLVEAAASGYRALGADINPVAVLVSRVKTTSLDPADTREVIRLGRALDRAAARFDANEAALRASVPPERVPVFPNRSLWFTDIAALELAHAKRLLDRARTRRAADLGLCAFSAVLVSVSNQESETRWCAKRRELPCGEVTRRLAQKLRDSLGRVGEYAAVAPAPALAVEANARGLPFPSDSVGLVVTSPPYANSHDYYLYNKLRLFWLGRQVAPVQAAEIGSRNRHSDLKQPIGQYVSEMQDVLREIHRCLVKGGKAAIVVGDAVVRREFFPMDRIFARIGVRAGLSLLEEHHFEHRRFNTAFQREFGTRRKKRTHVLVFEKR
jgi:site-specific DNA-methyltransferase (cytosine-N4-specific)